MLPFSAIIGQEDAKLALLLAAIDPTIGGVLLAGDKGTGKSSIVRSFARILPDIEVVAGCRYNCSPSLPDEMCDDCRRKYASFDNRAPALQKTPHIVNIPLGTTEDRLLGTVDMEKLLNTGEVHFAPGLLAEANRQILYIDEVNLLPDNITDDILDAAAGGVNTVEREGISISHPSKFLLVGTMNPEEGQLRPQILDRFALSVKMRTINEPHLREEIVKRAIASAGAPRDFEKIFDKANDALKQKITSARERLQDVEIPMKHISAVSLAMSQLGVDGQRPDIVIVKSAIACAALDNDKKVAEAHIEKVAPLAVCHRTRNGGMEQPPEQDKVKEALVEAFKVIKECKTETQTLRLNGIAQMVIQSAMSAIEQASEEIKKNE